MEGKVRYTVPLPLEEDNPVLKEFIQLSPWRYIHTCRSILIILQLEGSESVKGDNDSDGGLNED